MITYRASDFALRADCKINFFQPDFERYAFNTENRVLNSFTSPDEILFFFDLQYNIKKREEVQEIQQEEPNPLMRKKKTPEELAAEAEAEDEDEFTSMFTILFQIYVKCKVQRELFFRPISSAIEDTTNTKLFVSL